MGPNYQKGQGEDSPRFFLECLSPSLMACDTVVFPFDGREHELRLVLHLVPPWLEQYKPILKKHRPRIVIYTESAALAADIASRIGRGCVGTDHGTARASRATPHAGRVIFYSIFLT